MKRLFITCLATAILTSTNAQETNFTLSGGYVFSNLEEYDENTSGWRLTGLFEYNPLTSNLSHGFTFGYVNSNVKVNEGTVTETKFNARHWPCYYVPKYNFGDKAIRPYVKGALGLHISSYDLDGPLMIQLEIGDAGFYGGAGAGLNGAIGERFLINLEYEWAYLANTWYGNGFINSITLGAGIKF